MTIIPQGYIARFFRFSSHKVIAGIVALLVVGCAEKTDVFENCDKRIILKDESGKILANVSGFEFVELIRIAGGKSGIFLQFLSSDVISLKNSFSLRKGERMHVFYDSILVAETVVPNDQFFGTLTFIALHQRDLIKHLRAMECGNPGANEAMRKLLRIVR
jgi:hypothetical protein